MAHAHIPVVPLTNRRAYSLAEVAAVTGFTAQALSSASGSIYAVPQLVAERLGASAQV